MFLLTEVYHARGSYTCKYFTCIFIISNAMYAIHLNQIIERVKQITVLKLTPQNVLWAQVLFQPFWVGSRTGLCSAKREIGGRDSISSLLFWRVQHIKDKKCCRGKQQSMVFYNITSIGVTIKPKVRPWEVRHTLICFWSFDGLWDAV